MDKWDLVYESPSIVLKNKLGRKSNNSENEMKTSSLKYISETHTNKVKIYTDGSKDPTANTVRLESEIDMAFMENKCQAAVTLDLEKAFDLACSMGLAGSWLLWSRSWAIHPKSN